MSAVDEFGFLRFRATAWWSWSDSNQPPKCYGTWFESDQLPWSKPIQIAARTRSANSIDLEPRLRDLGSILSERRADVFLAVLTNGTHVRIDNTSESDHWIA